MIPSLFWARTPFVVREASVWYPTDYQTYFWEHCKSAVYNSKVDLNDLCKYQKLEHLYIYGVSRLPIIDFSQDHLQFLRTLKSLKLVTKLQNPIVIDETFTRLNYLSFSRSNVTSITNKTIKVLELVNVAHITTKDLLALPSLEKLTLSRFTNVDFLQLTNLKTLMLSYLSTEPVTFEPLKKLKDLSFLGIKSHNSMIKNCESLEKLYIDVRYSRSITSKGVNRCKKLKVLKVVETDGFAFDDSNIKNKNLRIIRIPTLRTLNGGTISITLK